MQRPLLTLALLTFALGCNAKAQANGESQDGAEKPASSNEAYDLAVSVEPGPHTAGAEGAYRVTITPKGEWVLKTSTPFKAKLTASDNVTLAKAELGVDDFDDPKSAAKSASCSVKLGGAGPATVNADLSFFLCTEQICQRYKAKHELSLTIE